MTTVLAVANQKGGVAKTTTVASLGAALSALGRRVLVVDLDPQGCLTFSLGHNPDRLERSVHEVLLGEAEAKDVLLDTEEGMSLLPATIDLAGAEAMLLMKPGREYALKRALATLEGAFDVIVVAAHPHWVFSRSTGSQPRIRCSCRCSARPSRTAGWGSCSAP